MAKDLTNQTLHAQRLNIIYEGRFGTILRKLVTLNHQKWWIVATFPFLIHFLGIFIGIDYIYSLPIAFFFGTTLILLKKYYKPKLQELHVVGVDNTGKDPYYLHLGDATRSIDLIRYAAIVKDKTPEVLVYPILIDFDIALRDAVASKKVAIIEVIVDRLENVLPMVPAGGTLYNMMLEYKD